MMMQTSVAVSALVSLYYHGNPSKQPSNDQQHKTKCYVCPCKTIY